MSECDLEALLSGPEAAQIEFLDKYISDNIKELETTPEYLEELKRLIEMIATGNVLHFPSLQ